MYNKRKIFLLLIISLIGFSSCKKNVESSSPILTNTEPEIRLVNLSGDNKVLIQMLEFSSSQLFDQTLDELQAQMDEQDSIFLGSYSSLNEEEINDKEDEIGYNDRLPLDNFENYYGFTNSLKGSFENAEAVWLNSEELDTINHPYNTYNFSIVEMTLLNSDREVKIGDSILKLTKSGFVYIIDGNVNTLIRIRDGDVTALSEPNVITDISSDKSICEGWISYSMWHAYAYKKKVFKEVSFHNYPWKVTCKSRMISYKKKWNGKWKRYRINMGISNQVRWWDKNCFWVGSAYETYKYKNRKSYTRYNTIWGSILQYRTRSYSSYGGFKYNGYSKYVFIAW